MQPRKPERGFLLSVMLVLVTLGSLAGVAGSILIYSAIGRVAARQIDPTRGVAHAKRVIGFMLVAGLVEAACSFGMWTWKRWGVFGYVGMALAQLLVAAKLHYGQQLSYPHLIGVGLVLAAVLPKWSHFDS